MATETYSRLELDRLILARLHEQLTGITVYDGEADATPAQLSAHDPRVKPYVVYWPDVGHHGFDSGDTELGGGHLDLVYAPQFTCVAGYRTACTNLIDRLDRALNGWRPPVPANWSPGPMRVPLGYTTRITREDDVTPPRFSGFPQFQTRIAT